MAEPYVRIIEQPAEKMIRFRYESEGRTNCTVLGNEHTPKKPSYPKIEIGNVTGTVIILISCVTNDTHERQHPHKLATKGTVQNGGVYGLRKKVTKSGVIEIKDMSIVAVKRQDAKVSLEERREKKIDPTNGGWSHINRPHVIDFHSVRLCFQVLLEREKCDENQQAKPLGHVVSNPIMNRKTNGLLKIIQLSSCSSSVMGGECIMMLTEKVKREDIVVIFYEEDAQKKLIWKKELDYINSKIKVHHQYTMVFNTPAYRDYDIVEPRRTFLQIFRPSDQECSESVPFTFVPNEQSIQLKRKKIEKKTSETVIATIKSKKPAQKHEVQMDKSKYVPNILIEANRNDGNGHIVHNQPLGNLDDVDEKENRSVTNVMQNHNDQGSFQPSMYPQYGNPNIGNYRYTQYTSNQNGNSYFDQLCREQTPVIPQSVCMMPTFYQQQPLQPQPNSFHLYPNNYAMSSTQNMNMFGNGYGAQCINPPANYPINPLMNCMPSSYNDNNDMTLNRIDHSMNSKRPTDINFQPNASNIPDVAQNTTAETFSNIDFSNIDELANSMDNISLDNVKPTI